MKVDVSKSEEVERWVQSAVREFGGRLDGAANVAGIAGGTGDITCETLVSSSSWLYHSQNFAIYQKRGGN